MKLSDCEISHRHVRGTNVVILCGSVALDDAQRAALLNEYREAFGRSNTPGYFSPAGFQSLADVQRPEPPAAAPVSAAPRPAEDDPVISARRRK